MYRINPFQPIMQFVSDLKDVLPEVEAASMLSRSAAYGFFEDNG